MDMQEIKQLKEAYSLVQAQQALEEGWILLAVAGQAGEPLYVLGKKEPKGKLSDLVNKMKGERDNRPRNDSERPD